MNKRILNEVVNKIKKAERIAVVTHILPDGDAVGSALSLWRVLTKAGKKCDCLCDSELPNSVKGRPFEEHYNIQTLNEYDLAISVDLSDVVRAGKYAYLFDGKNCISIDHHKGRTPFSALDLVDYRSSNCEIMLELYLEAFAEYIDKDVATLLYVGLVTDTGGFAYEYVDARSHVCAEKLFSYGIDASFLYRKYYLERPLNVVKMHAYVVSHCIYELDDELAILVFSREVLDKFHGDITDTSSAISTVVNAIEVKVGISITEVETNKYKVSLRSKGAVDVNAVAAAFGGGGHVNASGCRLQGELGIVIDKLVFEVSKYL